MFTVVDISTVGNNYNSVADSVAYSVADRQSWGQVHRYLYLPVLKYIFLSTC